MSTQLIKAVLNLESCAMRWAHEQSEEGDYTNLIAARFEVFALLLDKSTSSNTIISTPEFDFSTYKVAGESPWLKHTSIGAKVTHSSGIFEECHSQRSQWANEEIAFYKLKARLEEAKDINALAKVYSSMYASPHHITFTLEGLKNLIAEVQKAKNE